MIYTGPRIVRVVLDNSLLPLIGTAAAVVWANADSRSYNTLAHRLHLLVNDVGMVSFFALAAKEVFEATFSGGPLASPRRALSPLAAAVGGMTAPALIYVADVFDDFVRVRESAAKKVRDKIDTRADPRRTRFSTITCATSSGAFHSGNVMFSYHSGALSGWPRVERHLNWSVDDNCVHHIDGHGVVITSHVHRTRRRWLRRSVP